MEYNKIQIILGKNNDCSVTVMNGEEDVFVGYIQDFDESLVKEILNQDFTYKGFFSGYSEADL